MLSIEARAQMTLQWICPNMGLTYGFYTFLFPGTVFSVTQLQSWILLSTEILFRMLYE